MRRLRHVFLLLLGLIPLAVAWNYFRALDQETGGLVFTLQRLGLYLALLICGVWIFVRAIRKRSHSRHDPRKDENAD